MLVEDTLLPLTTNNLISSLPVENQLVGVDVLFHHQRVWLDPLGQVGGAHQNATTLQLKFVIIVCNGNTYSIIIYSHHVICSLGQKSPRAGTPGFRPPEVLLKYPNQTTGDISMMSLLHHHQLL